MKEFDVILEVEHWSWRHYLDVCAWLKDNFGAPGEPTKSRWLTIHDYDFITLCMDTDVYSWYLLTWA